MIKSKSKQRWEEMRSRVESEGWETKRVKGHRGNDYVVLICG